MGYKQKYDDHFMRLQLYAQSRTSHRQLMSSLETKKVVKQKIIKVIKYFIAVKM